jgi:predicted ATPase/class 3 adenylate cyclase
MRCTKCGTENREGARFCNDCATPLAAQCPACGAVNKPSSRFCDACATALSARPREPVEPQLAPAVRFAAEDPGAQASDGERKTVTALFADIKGSMELMEDLDPEEARAIVDPALKLMIEAVRRYDGYIVQSTGDGIFALFGAPLAHEDHPQRALYAALRIQEELRRYSAKLREGVNLAVEARVGVNTGEVVVRSIATGEGHTEYTPIGHSTNLAARMQALAPTGSIATTEQTRKLCEGYFTFKPLGPTRIKGVSEPVTVVEVIGLGPLRTRLQASVRRGLTRFVGREAELRQIKGALELARAGHGQIVAAIGEPGVGKSRLFFEFKAASQAGCLVLEAFSVSHGKATAYLPVIDLLNSYAGISVDDDARRRREKMAGKIVMLDRALEDTLAYLFALLGIEETAGALADMDGQIRRRRTLDAIKRLLLRESLTQPLIVIFEDLHWIDGETQALLDLLADAIANARLLLLVNYRPEYRHQWSNRGYYTQLRLDALGKQSAEEMLSALIASPVPDVSAAANLERTGGLDDLKHLIIERTEGNPFFMEEMVQALFEQGALVRNGGVHLTAPLSQLRIPSTVQAILAARIDRLAPASRQLLQTLAVVGREFPLPLIKSVAQAGDDELERMLAELQLGEFIHEQPAIAEVEYAFKHALTQEVAYNSLLNERRMLLHARTGVAVEALYAGHLEDHLSELARHYSRSSNTVKALEFLRRAGEQAVNRSAYQEAFSQLNDALRMSEKLEPGKARDSQELAIRMALAVPILVISGFTSESARVNLERARSLCGGMHNPMTTVRILTHLRSFYFVRGELRIAAELGQEALIAANRHPNHITTYVAGFGSAVVAAWTGKLRSAREHIERALAVPETMLSSVSPPLTAGVGAHIYILWMLGYPDQAIREQKRLQRVLERETRLFVRATSIAQSLLTKCDFLRDYRGARQEAETMLLITRENGFPTILPNILVRFGRIQVEEGNLTGGIETILEGRRIYKADDGKLMYAYSCCVLAEAYLRAQLPSEGLASIEEGIAFAQRDGNRFCEPELHRIKGELLLEAGAPADAAETCFREAIAIAQQREARSWELRAKSSLARLLDWKGKREEARATLAEIYNWFTEGFDTADLKDAKALLNELGA